LASAVDALGVLDPAELGDAELHDIVTALQHESSRFAAIRARLTAAWDSRRLWADDGSKSAAARLAREGDASPMTARVELRRARKLRTMPATAAALAEGKLSIDKADLLAQANQPEIAYLFARDEQLLLEEIKPLRFADAVSAVQYWVRLAEDEVGRKPSSCRHEGRHLTAVRASSAPWTCGGPSTSSGAPGSWVSWSASSLSSSKPTGPKPARPTATTPGSSTWPAPVPSAAPMRWH
jgi:hypothetical protein